MFEDVYKKIVSDKKVKMIGIWDKDGLEIDKIVYNELDNINTDVIGAEMADITSRISDFKYYDSYSITLEYKDFDIYVFSLMQEYFLLMATDKDVLSNRIKFYVDINKEKIISKL